MVKTEIVALSVSESCVNRGEEQIKSDLEKSGLYSADYTSRRYAPSDEVSRVSSGESPSSQKYSWLTNVDDSVLSGAARWEHPIYTYRTVVKDLEMEVERALDRTSLPSNLRVFIRDIGGPVRQQKNRSTGNVPFSYDPEDDYKTEQ
jgi:hypothetical protein